MGIYLYLGNSTIIRNNITSNGGYGIYIFSTTNNNITGNVFTKDGIVLMGNKLSDHNSHTIPTSNIVNNKPVYYYKDTNGINLNGVQAGQLIFANCEDIDLQNLEVTNTDIAIQTFFSRKMNLRDSNISSNYVRGLYIFRTYDIHLEHNEITFNVKQGLYIRESVNNSIEYNNLTNNEIGFYLDDSINSTINYNNVSSNIEEGVYFSESSKGNVSGNILSFNGKGIELAVSDNVTVVNNTVSSNTGFGIYVYYTSFSVIAHNIVSNGDMRAIYLMRSSNNTFESNFVSTNVYDGFFVHSSDYNTFVNNTSIMNSDGFFLTSSSNNLLKNNLAFENRGGGIGISSSSNYNTADYNILDSNGPYGIRVSASMRNVLKYNNVISNDIGIQISSSSNNSIYHNNIIFNTLQSYDGTDTNIWNVSYPSGGNYWSDFDDPFEGAYDDYNGVDQDFLGYDGIVDNGSGSGGGINPYVIDSDSWDFYPLVDPIANFTFLYKGWNLISIPFIQSDNDFNVILDSISGSYDAIQWYNNTDSADHWKHNSALKPSWLNDLNNIDHSIGLWIHISTPGGVLFEYPGTQPTSNQTIQIYEGWNMVGYPSLTNHNRTTGLNNLEFGVDVDAIQWYDTPTKTWHFMGQDDPFVPGRGYWMHSRVEVGWEVPL
jgi:parallel beta-helix repeat protein